VPFRRRRNVEIMLRNARIHAEWIDPPTPDQIRAKDRERLMEMLTTPVDADDDDKQFAEQLMERLSAAEIAAALVRSLRTDLPSPEDVLVPGARQEPGEPGRRPGFEGSVWFRINAGRRHNADPRWLLPLICRYGHVGREVIGAIRIAANESYFEVAERSAPGFMKALSRATVAPEDNGMVIDQAEPRPDAPSQLRGPKKPNPRSNPRKPASKGHKQRH